MCKQTWPIIITLLVLQFICCHKSSKENPDAGADASGDTDYLEEGDLVHGLDITNVTIYQSIKIPLMEDWQDATDFPVPLIEGRDTMLRIYVKRQTQWQPHDVVTQLDIESDLVETEPIKWFSAITADSSDYDLNSTINLNVPGNYLAADSSISVSLREWSSGALPKGTTDKAVWPASGTFDLAAQKVDLPLRLVLVPVRYWADESGRYPDMSAPQIQRYINTIYAHYPIHTVEVTELEPMDWDQPIYSNGDGWVAVLMAMMNLRATMGASTEEYYYGLFEPADTIEEYITSGGGGVAGMSNLAIQPTDAWARTSVSLGYPGQDSADTIVHELGHAHGREHAPCGVGDADPAYPYPGASIGTWGYDLENEELKDPTLYYDFMSYCWPTWISDYNYNALFDRINAVNELASKKGPVGPPQAWYSIAIDIAGDASLGPVFWLETPPIGREREIEFLDNGGNAVATVTARFQPFSYPPAGLVVFSDLPKGATQVRLSGGRTVSLTDALQR